MKESTPEYQYNLKSPGQRAAYLYNKDETETTISTLEDDEAQTEQGQFLYYDEAVTVNHSLFDYTYRRSGGNHATTKSTRLLGVNTNATYGLAKSVSVMPGDVINMEVYAKYVDTEQTNWNATLQNVMAVVANPASPQGAIDNGAPGSLGGQGLFFAPIDHASDGTAGPKAYLNYIVFGRDITAPPLDMGFVPVPANAMESGTDIDHMLMAASITIKEAGYVYIYLSNENPTPVEVYFDDFKVEHVKSPVIQTDDYYPFGLTFNSSRRENSVENKIKFQGQEHIDDLGLNWDSFKWRNHQPDIGRFFNVDPLAEKYYYNSPYAFSENKVVAHRELEGLESQSIHLNQEIKKVEAAWNNFVNKIEQAVDKVMSTVTQEGKTDSEKKNETPVAVDEKQQTQIAPTDGALNLNGTTNPLYNPDGVSEGDGGKNIMMSEKGQKKVENPDKTPTNVTIDTIGTSGNVDQNGNIYNTYYVIQNGQDTIDQRGYVPDNMMPKKVIPATTKKN